MSIDELQLLHCAATGGLLFHKGAWGDRPGYRWNDLDSTGGPVPPWQCEILDALEGHGYIAIEPRLGPLERKVVVTQLGLNALHGIAKAA